ncbi:hypothetical protein HYU94_00575 [Candidatus Daviesbacteria bacterium]|nr:hypothetical protein [Candidatus Daviesbacteria bacterium]
MANLGFLAAIGAALSWGSYLVPFKAAKSDKLLLFQAIMAVGILLTGFIISLFFNFPLNLNLYGLIVGMLWAIPNALSLVAVSNLGIARAVPLIASLVVLSSFLWGIFLKELSTGLILGFIAIGLIILGVILISVTENTQSQNVKKGIITAVLAGLLWGTQFVPVKIAHTAPQDYFFSMSVGIFATGMVIALFKKVKFQNIAIKASLLSGVIWSIGNLLGILAISLIGLAKGLPITQLAVLVAVLWGVFLIGALVLISGVITLGLA